MSTNDEIFHLERVNHQELLQVLLSFFVMLKVDHKDIGIREMGQISF